MLKKIKAQKVRSKSGQLPDVDKCHQDIIFPGQMLLWQLASVNDGPRNLLLKFGQNQVSKSRDIPDMDKCHQEKCRLDKCHHDSWNLFLPLKFGQNQVGNSWDIADIEFVWWRVMYAESVWRLTQHNVMLGWIVVELGFGQFMCFKTRFCFTNISAPWNGTEMVLYSKE